jgi:acetoacetyl-CoA synthetase
MARDGIEGKLTVIWQTVFRLPRIGRQEDFFDLGGTSLQAAEVLARIETAFNVALPPSTLAEHSTIEAVAVLLADRTIVRSNSPLVLLRGAAAGRPLFLAHNGKGSVSTYGQLARRLRERPVYGLQSRGLLGESWPMMSIPAMARYYLPNILEADPTGPYLLAGTCMGGIVAFELARQLIQLGKPVGFVGLMDTNTPPYSGRRSRWEERAVDPVRDFVRTLRWGLLRGLGQAHRPRWLPGYRHFVAGMNARASRRYRPTRYPGIITLFLTATGREGEDRRPLMSRYARETRTVTVAGARRDLFVPPALDILAARLQEALDAAEAGR